MQYKALAVRSLAAEIRRFLNGSTDKKPSNGLHYGGQRICYKGPIRSDSFEGPAVL